MKLNYLRAIGTVLLLSCVFPVVAQELTVTDPWVRAAPPNARALGAFMILGNSSGADRAVVAARTTLAVDRVELHRTVKDGEVMKMVPQDSIPVPANGSVKLKPGSWHVMLIGPETVPEMGSRVRLTLVFDDGSEQTVDAVVRQGKKMHGAGHEKKHDEKHMKKHMKKHKHDHAHEPGQEPQPGQAHQHEHTHTHSHEHTHE